MVVVRVGIQLVLAIALHRQHPEGGLEVTTAPVMNIAIVIVSETGDLTDTHLRVTSEFSQLSSQPFVSCSCANPAVIGGETATAHAAQDGDTNFARPWTTI